MIWFMSTPPLMQNIRTTCCRRNPCGRVLPVVEETLVVVRPCDAAELDKLELVLQRTGRSILLTDGHHVDRRPVGAAGAEAVRVELAILAELTTLR